MADGAVACVHCHTPLPENSRYCLACGADVSGGGPQTAGVEGLQSRLQRIVEGKYQLERMLGKGGMGAVYLAHDRTLEREVAIKVLPPDVAQDDQVVRRFQQEAKTAAKLDHPNIIPIYRVESEGGLNYFVMKFISGTSLEDVLERREPLSFEYIQRVLWEAACALGHAHQRHVVHRDVKPANIMFDHDGRVMLTDFGISKALQAATGFTATGMIIGTPHYMAPEQAKGQAVDGRADQYSLGVIGYRMITNELPFTGDSVHTILYKHIFEEPPLAKSLRADVPGFLSAAISRALSKEPDHRFPTMEEFATAVWPEQPVAAPTAGRGSARRGARPPAATADAPTEITSAPTTPIPSVRARPAAAKPAPRKSRAGAAVAAVVVLGAAGAGWYFLLGPGRSAAAPQRTEPEQQSGAETTRALTSSPRETTTAAVQPRRGTPKKTAPPPPPVAPAVEQAQITVASDPPGELFIDGTDVGQTPVVEYRVSPGAHSIRLERPGCTTVNDRLQVDVKNTVRKRYSLICGAPER